MDGKSVLTSMNGIGTSLIRPMVMSTSPSPPMQISVNSFPARYPPVVLTPQSTMRAPLSSSCETALNSSGNSKRSSKISSASSFTLSMWKTSSEYKRWGNR